MLQNKTPTKEQRSAKVAKKSKGLLQVSDQTDSAPSSAHSPKRDGAKASKSAAKQGKKKMAKLGKRSGSASSKKDNVHNPANQSEQAAHQDMLAGQAQLFKVTSTKLEESANSHDYEEANGAYVTSV